MSTQGFHTGRRTFPPTAAAFSGLAVLFVFAYAGDAYINQLEEYAASTFDFIPVILLSAAVPFSIAVLVLAFTWLILVRLPRSRSASALAIAAGLCAALLYLSVMTSFPDWLRQTPIGWFRYHMMNVERQSALYYLSTSWIVVGIAGLPGRVPAP
jgi:hypothetical protein